MRKRSLRDEAVVMSVGVGWMGAGGSMTEIEMDSTRIHEVKSNAGALPNVGYRLGQEAPREEQGSHCPQVQGMCFTAVFVRKVSELTHLVCRMCTSLSL